MARLPRANEPTWDDAIGQILQIEGGALHYAEIANRIVTSGIKTFVGATPRHTVASILSTSIRSGSSPYRKVAKGEFALAQTLDAAAQAPLIETEAAGDVDSGALRALGMYWRREAVVWSTRPKILGRQSAGATNVDFAEQLGIYLLHDRDRIIYVGRAADALVSRLKAHTIDRLEGRWDRFSWFGLRDVGADGALSDAHTTWDQDAVIETLEALLIECLEPPQNRRRGDNLAAIEFLQVKDPDIDRKKNSQLLTELAKRMELDG